MTTVRRALAALLLTGLALGLAPSAGAAEIVVAGNQVLLTGRIEPESYHRFRQAIERSETPVDTVILRGSPGGTVASAESIMTVIWNRGMTTAISGPCSSACAVIFLAGRQRRFTEEQPATRTYLMFHGCYLSDGFARGTIRWNHTCSQQIERTIRDYTDKRLDESLLKRWIATQDNRGGAYFFDSRRLRRSDGVSAFFCDGPETRKVEACEKLGGVDAYALGLVTPGAPIKVHPELALNRPAPTR